MEYSVDDFFDRYFESTINELMKENSFKFPLADVADYINQILAIPYQKFVDYVCTNINNIEIKSSDITQCSDFGACTDKICEVFINKGDPGFQNIDVGKLLLGVEEEKKKGAYLKYGENQAKTAEQLGLVHNYYDVWFITCLGKAYMYLNSEQKEALLARTVLRNVFYEKIISEASFHEVDVMNYMNCISEATRRRRGPSVMKLLRLCSKSCSKENVLLYPISFKYGNKVETLSMSPVAAEEDNVIEDESQVDAVELNVKIEEELKFEKNESQKKRVRGKNSFLKVTYPNEGHVIINRNSVKTYLAVLDDWFLELVPQIDFGNYELPLFSTEKYNGDKYNNPQKLLQGKYYIWTHLSNLDKQKILQKISDELELNLKIELVLPNSKDQKLPLFDSNDNTEIIVPSSFDTKELLGFDMEVNWSLFTYGFNIVKEHQSSFYSALSFHPELGKKVPFRLIVEGEEYNVALYLFKQGKDDDSADVLQIRYGKNSDAAKKIRSLFPEYYQYCIEFKSNKEQGRIVKIPEYFQYRIHVSYVGNNTFTLLPINNSSLKFRHMAKRLSRTAKEFLENVIN